MKEADKIALKRTVLEACRKYQLDASEELKEVMKEAQDSANEYGAPKDRYDSFRTQLLRKRDMFAKQVHKATEQLDILDKVDPERLADKACFGAIVFTGEQKLFISAGIGKVNVDGDDYFVISPFVPFYAAIENLKKGDSFEFRGKKGKIVDVF